MDKNESIVSLVVAQEVQTLAIIPSSFSPQKESMNFLLISSYFSLLTIINC